MRQPASPHVTNVLVYRRAGSIAEVEALFILKWPPHCRPKPRSRRCLPRLRRSLPSDRRMGAAFL